MLNPSSIVRTDIYKRKGDGKFAVSAYMTDPNFVPEEYSKNKPLAYNPLRWITVAVFNTETEAEDYSRSLKKQKKAKLQQEKREQA